MELTDREFEKLLAEEEKQKKERRERKKKKAKHEHRSSRGRILNRRSDRSKTGKSDESEDEVGCVECCSRGFVLLILYIALTAMFLGHFVIDFSR